MRLISKLFKSDEDSIFQKIYLSDWFDPIYRLYRKPFNMYHYIEKFIYYGRVGASQCHDFEAGGVHSLIYAHMKRVHKYMNSNNTHLVWNDKPDTKPMRKLAEFLELSKRMSENEMSSYVNYDKVKAKYPEKGCMSIFENRGNTPYRQEIRAAFKKDKKVVDARLKRYYDLFEKELPGFWD